MPTDIEIARSVTPLPITEVAKNAGVGTGTLYRHFDGKGELFADVFQSVCSREVSAARDAGDNARSLEGNHRSAVSASKVIWPTAAPGDTFKPTAISSPRPAAAFFAAVSNCGCR